jgi:biopolymer transport protein TolR
MHVNKRSKKRAVAEINVVPYIDVMLVLLIIFMATAPVVMQSVKVDLPQTTSQQLSEDSELPVIAEVDKDGHYSIKLSTEDSKDVADLVELAGIVSDFHKTHPNVPVLVGGDKEVKYDAIIQLMASLKDAGVESVGLMTQPSSEQKK